MPENILGISGNILHIGSSGEIFVNSIPSFSYLKNLSYDASGNLLYIGTALPSSSSTGSVWQIKKLIYDGSNYLTNIQFAGSSANFSFAWNNRAGYTYG